MEGQVRVSEIADNALSCAVVGLHLGSLLRGIIVNSLTCCLCFHGHGKGNVAEDKIVYLLPFYIEIETRVFFFFPS